MPMCLFLTLNHSSQEYGNSMKIGKFKEIKLNKGEQEYLLVISY